MTIAILVTAIMALAALWAECSLSEDGLFDESSITRVVGLGLLAFAMTYFVNTYSSLFLGWVIYLGALLMIFVLGIDWKERGSEWVEMLPYIVIALGFLSIAADAVRIILAGGGIGVFLAAFLKLLPLLFMVGLVGSMIANYFKFRHDTVDNCVYLDDEDGDFEKRQKRRPFHKSMEKWTKIITAIIIIGLLINNLPWKAWNLFSDAKSGQATINKTTAASAVGTTTDETWYAFYNPSLQNDDDTSNDYNFGYNPREFHPEWEKSADAAKLFDADFRERMKGTSTKGADVALAASDMAWLDAIVGTRYLGGFYESCKKDWAKTINEAKVAFMKDQKLFQKTLEAFFKFLDSAVKVEVKDAKDMEDQMYMNPYTIDGVPDVIVMKTDDHTGKFLVYTFKIKDNYFEVAYRIDCGYQPTNVEKIMKITPEDPPKKPDDPPEKKKDKTKGTQGELVNPNDNKGPGEDTNNGKGATTSTKDQPTNSNHMTNKEYDKAIDDLKEINDNQKVPVDGDKNSPTVTPAPGAKADDNASSPSNPVGPINEPTPVKPPATGSDGEISPEPTEPWGGPAD